LFPLSLFSVSFRCLGDELEQKGKEPQLQLKNVEKVHASPIVVSLKTTGPFITSKFNTCFESLLLRFVLSPTPALKSSFTHGVFGLRSNSQRLLSDESCSRDPTFP
jgi:hypothetical protein